MHILGGFGIASLTGAILSYRGLKVSYKKLLIVYVLIALLWESYEHIHNFIAMGNWLGLRTLFEDVFDTVKDVINGFIGMSVAYLFVQKK